MSVYIPGLSVFRREAESTDGGRRQPDFPLFALLSVLLATVVLAAMVAWGGARQDRLTEEVVQEALHVTEIRGAPLGSIAGAGAETHMRRQQERIARAAEFRLISSGVSGALIFVAWLHLVRALGGWWRRVAGAEAHIRNLSSDPLTGLPYCATTAGRSGFRFFEEEMNLRLQARRAMECDLREALAERQFELHYQPQVDLASGRVCGVEALLRWRHPRRGLVLPMDFIPLAEETGLIDALGQSVLLSACRQATMWPRLRMAVNLSAAQFRVPGLHGMIAAALEETGLPPERLELEITESVLLDDTAPTLATLRSLQAMGVRVAMDDFGTGYSSLGYLRRFPFHKIKIDRSFVQDVTSSAEAEAIIRAILLLGRTLGMTTCAEGVETAAQAETLKAMGCQEVQGFHFGRPMRADAIDRLLEACESPWADQAAHAA